MYEYRVEVLRVVDGDTVDVDVDLGFSTWLREQRIRLAGIDAPESRTKDDMEKLYGQLSKKFLSEILQDATVVLQSHGRGKFGRILGTLFVDGKDVNKEMVAAHHAVLYEGQSKALVGDAHDQNRQDLRASGYAEKFLSEVVEEAKAAKND